MNLTHFLNYVTVITYSKSKSVEIENVILRVSLAIKGLREGGLWCWNCSVSRLWWWLRECTRDRIA